MPRQGRIVFPGVPLHVTQRGNRRERIFLEPGDQEAYLCLLHCYAKRFRLAIFAYCLMPNHIHLVVVPADLDGMHRALRAVHSQYAQRLNRMRKTSGHVWQGRYYSCPLDANHFLNAIRYVELNPVDGGLVARAEDYRWSSAAAHCGLRHDPLLELPKESPLLAGIADWKRWLACGVPNECRKTLLQNECRNLPCGSDKFIADLEESAGRALRFRTRGGQKKR